MDILQAAMVLFTAWLVSGTLLSLSTSPHWYIRGWDFPRVLIAILAAATAAAFAVLCYDGHAWERVLLLALAAVVGWQAWKILPFTRLGPRMVEEARRPDGSERLRILIANVLMENEEHALLLAEARGVDPDVVVLVEVDERWMRGIAPLRATHPHEVAQPQGNCYGMAVLSRFPLRSGQVRFLVDREVPSIRCELEMPSGKPVTLFAIHPKPPEPIRDQDSAPRDAELVLVAREIEASQPQPVVVCGDLNDVAWSYTTTLFLRIAKMLDPRRGRGMFSTYHARYPFFRFPLDHVFHSDDFRLVALRRMGNVGSDHFPVFIDLSLEPEAHAAQPAPVETSADRRNARQMVAEGAARGAAS